MVTHRQWGAGAQFLGIGGGLGDLRGRDRSKAFIKGRHRPRGMPGSSGTDQSISPQPPSQGITPTPVSAGPMWKVSAWACTAEEWGNFAAAAKRQAGGHNHLERRVFPAQAFWPWAIDCSDLVPGPHPDTEHHEAEVGPGRSWRPRYSHHVAFIFPPTARWIQTE